MPDFVIDFWGLLSSSVIGESLAGFWLWLANLGESAITEIENDKNGFLNILGMTGIALLAVMIPVVVAIFSIDKNLQQDYKVLDWYVMLEDIVKARWLLICVGLIYAPLILWGVTSTHWAQGVYFVVWLSGILGMTAILWKTYRWVRGDRLEPRNSYLQKLGDSDNSEEMFRSWRSVWETEIIKKSAELVFFDIFVQSIMKLLEKDSEWEDDKKINVVHTLLNDFHSFINKRLSLFIWGKSSKKILELHFLIWKKTGKLRGNSYKWLSYNQAFDLISRTVEDIGKMMLTGGGAFVFFSALKEHIDDVFSEKKEDGKLYSKRLIVRVLNTLVINLKNQDVSNRCDVWESFPDEWKITAENIKTRESYISQILTKWFFEWALSKIRGTAKADLVLTDVAINLFPKTCQVMWMRILVFLPRLLKGDKIKSLIESSAYFLGDRPANFETGTVEEIELKTQAEEEETITLTLLLLGRKFTEKRLEVYIAELEKLENSYNDDQGTECERIGYLYTFKKLLKARRAENAAG